MVGVKLGKEIYAEALLAKLGSHGYPRLMEADSGEQTATQAACPSRSRSLVTRDKGLRSGSGAPGLSRSGATPRRLLSPPGQAVGPWRTLQRRCVNCREAPLPAALEPVACESACDQPAVEAAFTWWCVFPPPRRR